VPWLTILIHLTRSLEYREGYRTRTSATCPNRRLRSPGGIAQVLRRQGRTADRLNARPHRGGRRRLNVRHPAWPLAGRKIAFDRDAFKATVDGRISGIGKTIRIKSIHVHYDLRCPRTREKRPSARSSCIPRAARRTRA